MEVANVAKLNSKSNTTLVAMTRVKDSHENIEIFFEEIKSQIKALKQLKWEGKKVVLFFGGDYDFLSKVFSLSGTYPCL
jgi:uncharacterized protein YukE